VGKGLSKLSPPRKFSSECVTDGFDCGEKALNSYLKGALRNQERNNATCIVVTDESSRVVGFYTLSSHAIKRLEPAKPRDLYNQAPDPVPTILLGRFAVDQSWQGKGLGKDLLRDALLRIASASESIGMRAAVVDAKNARVKTFYEGLGFKSINDPDNPMRLYLLVRDLHATLAELA
jgi:GNAT superfamily N-acetyltransferase